MLSKRALVKDSTIPATEFVGTFPKKGVSIIASKPGIGKTWYVLHNIITLSREGFKTCTFFGDCPPNVIYDRVNSMEDSGEEIPEERKQMYFLTDAVKEKKNMILTEPEGLHNFCEVLHYEKPDIVFIDTFSSLTTIEENSQKETANLFQKLLVVAEKYNCAIVIVHHLRKSSRKERAMSIDLDDVIGSSIITRLASIVLVLTKDKESQKIFVNVVKSWYASNEIPKCFKVKTLDNGYVKILTLHTQGEEQHNRAARAMITDWIVQFYREREKRGNIFVVDVVVAEVKTATSTTREILNALTKEEYPLIKAISTGSNSKKFFQIIDANIEKRYNFSNTNQERKGESNGGITDYQEQQSVTKAE